eukprot:superscaffoldBa00005757_g20750
MEPVNLVSVTPLWFENSSASLPSGPSESPVSAVWEIVHTIIPPYIFTLSLLGLLFNGFVLGVFLTHKDQLTVAEIYLSNLALADFILLCGLPFWAMYIRNDFNWAYGDALCKLVNSLIIINFYTSIYTLVMISVDRYLALVKTMKARWLRRTLYAKVICFFLWLLGFLLSMPVIFHRKVFTFLDTLCDVHVLDERLWAHTLDIGGQFSAYLAFLNSALNPLLYVFSGQYFRRKRVSQRQTEDSSRKEDYSVAVYLDIPHLDLLKRNGSSAYK